MIDAEQTYFQPAISRLVIEMMRRLVFAFYLALTACDAKECCRRYNKETCVVYNTYQAYLRRCSAAVRVDLNLAAREDFYFGCKLVRGFFK